MHKGETAVTDADTQDSATVRAAVIQAAPQAFDTPATLERMERLAGKAANEGARIAVFPEAFVGGYPKGMDFGARVGQRDDAGRDWFRRYHAAAIDLPGPELDRMCDIAAGHDLMIVAGVMERDGGTLYCTSVYIGADGSFLGKHRKPMPTAMERLIWGFGDGSTLTVVDTPLGAVGGAICWENYMPQLRLALYAKGVEIYCAPTVDDRDQWQHAMRHIAWEGRTFVLAACQYAVRADYPDDYDCMQGDDPATVLIRGGSVIVSPLGRVLAGPVYDEEAVLVADLDMGDIARGKYDLDVTGHYSRPDIFTLLVNEEAQGVVFGDGPAED